MAEIPIPEHWKTLWDRWDLRAFIFLSLFLQTFLVLVAPLRKRTSRSWIIMPLWSAYLLADWAANFAVGLISSSVSNNGKDSKHIANNGDLLAFWAPFLLVHLGGPDTITAFALEDNELWLRHLFGLFFQCLAAVYVFIQSLPRNKLWIPTMLMFMTGIIKYSERTRSLYLASASSFRDSMLTEPDPGPNYAKLMDEYFSKKEARLPTRIEMLPEPDRVVKAANKVKTDKLTDLQVVQYAFRYFETFKGLVVDLIFSFRERNQSRDFFLARSADDAFRVIEVELNFIYEVLYTKLPVVYDRVGYFCRTFSIIAVIISFTLFYYEEKKGFEGFDVAVTYTLLIGAMTLDMIAIIMLIFSDWTVVALKKSPDLDKSSSQSKANRFLSWLLSFKTKRSTISCFGIPIRIMHRRWGESMQTYNLIKYCLNKRSRRREQIYGYLGITGFLDEIWYVDRVRFTPELRDFIFEELKGKSEMADDLETAKEICSAKGEWVLRIEGYSSSELLPFVVDVDYDESLLLWHIATELCYNDKGDKAFNEDHRTFAKTISDYMIYLLVMQPNMMSAVAGIGQIRFRDTCAEATKFFNSGKLELKEPGGRKRIPEQLQKDVCERILDVNTEVKPVTVKGDRSKSVLFDASILAKELKKLPLKKEDHEGKDKWFIMSKVWVELLSYAASHVRSDSHAQQLSKGGDLITIVWLLMAHFGLGDQFQINEGHARAKLIVGK